MQAVLEHVFISLELCSKSGMIEGYRGEYAELVMRKTFKILTRARSSGRQRLAELIEACELSNGDRMKRLEAVDHTRDKPWPGVLSFISDLLTNTLLLDFSGGNGQNLCLSPMCRQCSFFKATLPNRGTAYDSINRERAWRRVGPFKSFRWCKCQESSA
jgi:hypothetical protein